MRPTILSTSGNRGRSVGAVARAAVLAIGWLSGAVGLGAVAALLTAASQPAGQYQWDLPPGFPMPRVPADNPMSAAKVELGRHLFYDRRLSGNETISCSTCHIQAFAFSDPRPRPIGITGEVHPRSSMSLANVAYAPVLTWANPTQRRLENQALVPMFGETPVEMGLAGKEAVLLDRLRAEPRYQALFPAAFPGDRDPISVPNVTRALASFQRTLLSGRSAFDRYQAGDTAALSPAARRGAALFNSERLECFHCHGGFNFTGSMDFEGKGFPEVEFHNTGLYNIDGRGGYPAPNTGVHEITGNPEDMGRFKAPTLRNVEVTAPYMHDGSIPTLEEVVEHYRTGGRTIASGPHAGVGADSPLVSPFVPGFAITDQEKADLIAFLRSLTDRSFLEDPRFADPWVHPFKDAR